MRGTPIYAGPESFDSNKKSITIKNDIYCLAMTLIDIMYPDRDTPYGKKLVDANFQKIFVLKFMDTLPDIEILQI